MCHATPYKNMISTNCFFLLLFLDWNIKFVTFPVFQNRFQFRQQVEIDQDEFVSKFVNALSIVMR